MKRILSLTILALVLAVACQAQTETMPTELAGAGITWNQYTAPAVMPFGFYAHRITGPLYSYTEYMATSIQRSPFRVQFAGMTGAAYCPKKFGRVYLCALGDLGGAHLSTEQDTVAGFSWGLGGMPVLPLGKGWMLMFPVRTLKANLPSTAPPGASDPQFKFAVAASWGK